MEYLNKQEYSLRFVQENIEMISYTFVCFFVPFLIGHPQFIVGTLVNAALVLAAMNIKNYRLLPVIIVPSLGALSRGLIFGPFSRFLVYMIPFIWIGNSLLVFAVKYFHLYRKLNRFFSLGIGATLLTMTSLLGNTIITIQTLAMISLIVIIMARKNIAEKSRNDA